VAFVVRSVYKVITCLFVKVQDLFIEDYMQYILINKIATIIFDDPLSHLAIDRPTVETFDKIVDARDRKQEINLCTS